MSDGLVRIGARIGKVQNDYLDSESKKTGISKSTLIHLAVDSYMRQNKSIATLEALLNEIQELKEIQKTQQSDE